MRRRACLSVPAAILFLADPAHAGLRDWLPWRSKDPEPAPEPMTVLGMDPLVALLVLIGVLGAGIALYYHPRAFMRGFAEMMGGMSAAFIGAIAGGVALVGAAVLFIDSAGISALVIFAVIGVIVVFGFLGGGV